MNCFNSSQDRIFTNFKAIKDIFYGFEVSENPILAAIETIHFLLVRRSCVFFFPASLKLTWVNKLLFQWKNQTLFQSINIAGSLFPN